MIWKHFERAICRRLFNDHRDAIDDEPQKKEPPHSTTNDDGEEDTDDAMEQQITLNLQRLSVAVEEEPPAEDGYDRKHASDRRPLPVEDCNDGHFSRFLWNIGRRIVIVLTLDHERLQTLQLRQITLLMQHHMFPVMSLNVLSF